MWGKQKPWSKNQEFYSSREVLLFCMRDWVIYRERMHYMEQKSQPLKPLKTFWVTIDFVTSIFLNALRNQFDLDIPVIKYIFKLIRVFVLFLEMQQITLFGPCASLITRFDMVSRDTHVKKACIKGATKSWLSNFFWKTKNLFEDMFFYTIEFL